MIPERCTLRKGSLRGVKTEFIARVAGEILVIKDVPGLICDRCGEAYYSVEVSRIFRHRYIATIEGGRAN
jgi:YgiT-type zinc finger domain-containing protein